MGREAIVLAGGLGTRLRSVVSEVPKPMAPVAGRPFLAYLLDRLVAQRYDHVVLATGYLHTRIEQYFGNCYRSLAVTYSQEEQPMGTGGAIRMALTHCRETSVTVLNGDTLFDISMDELYRQHQGRDAVLTIALRRVEDVSRYGAVAVDADGRIRSFVEKGKVSGSGWINGGIYILDSTLLNGWAVGMPFSFERDVMQAQYGDRAFYAQPSDAYFIDIGVPDDYRRAQRELPALFPAQ